MEVTRVPPVVHVPQVGNPCAKELIKASLTAGCDEISVEKWYLRNIWEKCIYMWFSISIFSSIWLLS